MRLVLVIAVFIIMQASDAIASTISNLFQLYVGEHHFGTHVFPMISNIALLITMFIMVICLFKKFQQLSFQRALLGFLIVPLFAVPVSVYTYPVISGFTVGITKLSGVWLQLCVPSALRATITSISTGVGGLIDIRGVTVENLWTMDLIRYRYILFCLVMSFGLFWWLSTVLQSSITIPQKKAINSGGILKLMVNYPHIFIICFCAGFNNGLISYTYILGSKISIIQSPEIYQYVISVGAVFIPIILGMIADRYSILYVTLYTILLLVFCTFINVALPLMHTTHAFAYYITAFVESGLIAGLMALSASLIGERLQQEGLFRAFAVSSIIMGIGGILYGRMFIRFHDSFVGVKFSVGMINILLLMLTVYFYCKKSGSKHVV